LRYRLVALDLDGTILDLKLNLDPRDVAALSRILKAGVTVVACTGRPFPGALPWSRGSASTARSFATRARRSACRMARRSSTTA